MTNHIDYIVHKGRHGTFVFAFFIPSLHSLFVNKITMLIRPYEIYHHVGQIHSCVTLTILPSYVLCVMVVTDFSTSGSVWETW